GLEQDDPRLAALLNSSTLPSLLRTRLRRGLVLFAAGLCVLVLGLVVRAPLIGVSGFAVMFLAGYWTTKDLRWPFGRARRQVPQLEGNND
ncbi:MAG: DUF3040 domain-containing protein, partial [Pseudarthrobacter sp.]|nr:DUF3040 domain-containing protein [Pseudarthrobacter sp.]